MLDVENALYWYNLPYTSALHAFYLSQPSLFDRLEPEQCSDLYGTNILSSPSHLFLVMNPTADFANLQRVGPIEKHYMWLNWTDIGLSEADAAATPLYW